MFHIWLNACLGLVYKFTVSGTEALLSNSDDLAPKIHLVLQVLTSAGKEQFAINPKYQAQGRE